MEERDVLTITKDGEVKDAGPITAEETPQEYEAKLVEVLSRDLLSDRLNVPLPEDMHGEWVLNDPVNINSKKLIGFEIDTKYAVKDALHSDGSGQPIVGDTIFMVIPKWKHNIFKKVQKKRYDEHHGVRTGKSSEEKEFLDKTNNNGMEGVDTGKTSKLDLKSVLSE